MKYLRLSFLLLACGALLFALGFVLKFVLVPQIKLVPADLDVTRTYEGTLLAMLDPNTFEFYQNEPIRIVRHIRVEKVDGRKSLVSEVAQLYLADAGDADSEGRLIQRRDTLYAIDRHTLQSIQGFGEDWPREGLTINYPIGTKKRDYLGWNEDAQKPTTARYMRTETHQGLKTYVFLLEAGPDPILDPFLLDLLPKELDKAFLANFVDQLPLSDFERALAERLLPTLPDPVPLDYSYTSEMTLWVEPMTGIVIDMERYEWRHVVLNGLPVAAIFEIFWRHTPQSTQDAIDQAKPLIRQVQLVEGILPWVGWLGGALLMGLGALLFRRR